MKYAKFLEQRKKLGNATGFEPVWTPDCLFDFQRHIVEWVIRMGRAAAFEDCGLGKTLQQLVVAENVVRHTNKPVLLATPLAVGAQTRKPIDLALRLYGLETAMLEDHASTSRTTSSFSTMSKALAHRTIVEDSTQCNIAAADYLIPFRKKGENPIPVTHPTGLESYAGEREIPADLHRYKNWKGKQTENRYSHWIWRNYASCFWDDVRLDRTLPYKEGRDENDERHMHPLQLDVIERSCVLWSNPGETVITPFMGVGSEVYGAVSLGRRGIGCELKPSYYSQAVKNMELLDSNQEYQSTLFDDDDVVDIRKQAEWGALVGPEAKVVK